MPKKMLIAQTTLWNNVMRLDYIDNSLATNDFKQCINKRTPHGFQTYFYSTSDASIHHNRSRNVLCITQHGNPDLTNIDVMLGLETASRYGGGTNDNAADAQVEILTTFDKIMVKVEAWRDSNPEDEDIQLRAYNLLYENGVKRRAINFGDPFHIANLVVTWASIGAFGDTEKADHTQVHHRQLLQSMHSLHNDNSTFSQRLMDDIMTDSTRLVIRTCRERVQRWLVNQRNAKRTLAMFAHTTVDGSNALIQWALTYANEARSDWKRRVGREIATWLSMPEIILGLTFEAELGIYFEEVYAWHNRKGPFNERPGFRMMEIFFLYLGFEIPWWNKAVDSPDLQMPKTMKYLSNNFTGDEYSFRHAQVMRGLTKGRDELIKMTSKCLFAVPIIYLLFSHHEHGASFLRAVLSVLHKFEQELDEEEVDQQDYILINQPGRKWGLYIHTNDNERPPEEKKWFDILYPQKCDVVHWWRQFHLNDE
eukprot:scaffold39740_cov82-Cyclotella_meneghiniana.AAC.1